MNKNIKALLLTIGIMISIVVGAFGFSWLCDNYYIYTGYVILILAVSALAVGIFRAVKEEIN